MDNCFFTLTSSELLSKWSHVLQILGKSVFNADDWKELWRNYTPISFDTQSRQLRLNNAKGYPMEMWGYFQFFQYTIFKVFGNDTILCIQNQDGDFEPVDSFAALTPSSTSHYQLAIDSWAYLVENGLPFEVENLMPFLRESCYSLIDSGKSFSSVETFLLLQNLELIYEGERFIVLNCPKSFLDDSDAIHWLQEIVFPNHGIYTIEFICSDC